MFEGRERRRRRIRIKLKKNTDKPRLTIFRSNKNIYAQLIDNKTNKVLASSSTLTKEFKALGLKSTNKEAATVIGKLIGKKILDLGIKEICFDRAGYKFHGRVKALAEGAREVGLKF